MIYLFQTTCYAALLFGIYLLFLRNRAAHAWSRVWLLMCAVLPFAIPFVTVPGLTDSLPAVARRYLIILPEVTVIAAPIAKGGEAYPWLTLIYAAIAALLLGRALVQYISFRRFIAAHTAREVDDIKVVYDKDTEPGSFGKYIFLPGTDSDAAIFEHEQAHIKLRHSADILLLRLLKIAFWPNVMLYVISRELRLVHEFQADAHSATDKQRYISTLLGTAFHTNRFTFTHTFFHHPLKRRIMMLQGSSLSSAKIRVIAFKTCSLAAVLFAGIVWLQSCRPELQKQISGSSSKGTVREYKDKNGNTITVVTLKGKSDTFNKSILDITGRAANDQELSEDALAHMIMGPSPDQVVKSEEVEHTADGRDIYKSVEKAPEPSVDLGKYLSENLKYPEIAIKNKIEGRVIVKFIVDENGKVTNPSIVQSNRRGAADKGGNKNAEPAVAAAASHAMEAEALRVISAMPNWKPGENQGKKVSVYFHLPISFRLN